MSGEDFVNWKELPPTERSIQSSERSLEAKDINAIADAAEKVAMKLGFGIPEAATMRQNVGAAFNLIAENLGVAAYGQRLEELLAPTLNLFAAKQLDASTFEPIARLRMMAHVKDQMAMYAAAVNKWARDNGGGS